MRDFRADHDEMARIWARPAGWARFAEIHHRVIGLRWSCAALVYAMLGVFTGPIGDVAPVAGVPWSVPLFAGLGVLCAPQVTGARDLAFPRLIALGFWLYLGGGGLVAAAPLAGGAARVDLWLAGTVLVAGACGMAGVVLVASVLVLRRAGLALARIGAAGWAALGGGGLLVLAMPPSGLGAGLTWAGVRFGLPFDGMAFDGMAGAGRAPWHSGMAVLFAGLAGVLALAAWIGRGRKGAQVEVLAMPRHGWRETLGVSALRGGPEQVVMLPEPTVLPLWVALVIGAAMLALFGGVWVLAGAFACLAVAIALAFPVHPAAGHDLGLLRVCAGLELPTGYETARPVLLWGVRLAVLADAAGVVALVIGAGALAAGWPAEAVPELPRGLQIVTLASLIGCVVTADKALRRGRKSVLDVLGAGTWALAVLLTPVAMIQRLPDVTAHPAAALVLVMLLGLCLRGGVGVLVAGVALWRRIGGQVSDARRTDLRLLRFWQRWLAVAGVLAMAFPHALRGIAAAG